MPDEYRRTRPLLNLIGMNRPWTCSRHNLDCPAGSAGCPSCVAEAASWKDCKTCAGSGWVCENHHDKPWGGLYCDASQSGVCEHGACGCGAGDPCPTCNQKPTLFSGFVEIIASVED